MFGKGKLMSTGAEAPALVLDVAVHSMTPQGATVVSCTYTLSVRFEDGTAAEISRRVRNADAAWLSAGDLCPVRYDPDDRTKIEVDEPALKERKEARAKALRDAAVASGERAMAAARDAPVAEDTTGMSDADRLRVTLANRRAGRRD